MIKQFKVQNYLSLKDFTLDLESQNVLVGPNMAGKSNIVDAFRFLPHIALTRLMDAINHRGGFSEILWKGLDEGQINFSATIEINVDKSEPSRIYEYDLSLSGSTRSGIGGFVIEKETLKRCDAIDEYILADFKNGQGKGFHKDGSVAFEEAKPSFKSLLEYSVPGWEGMVVRNFIAFWRFYRLVPNAMKQSNPVSEQFFLNEHGDNLSAWLHNLQTRYRDDYRRLEQAVQGVLPDIKEVISPPTQAGMTFLQTIEKHLKRPISIWRISDGTLQFLALVSLIFAPPELGAPLFCIEEPENHLHPRMLESLMEIYQQRFQELGIEVAQVIVTTHSLKLVDLVTLENLVVVEKKEGATYCSRPSSKKHLKELIESEEYGLGDLFYSGALGND